MSASGKLAILITGCSPGGMGAALATAFHGMGHHVYATARNPSKLTPLADKGMHTLPLDITSPTSIAAAVASVTATLPPNKGLDILVNNAAAVYLMPLSDVSPDAIRDIFNLNVFSQLAVTQAFLPLLLRAAQSHSSSSSHFQPIIANHTSVGSVTALPFQGVYNASKAALAMLTTTLRMELAAFGIRVVDLKTGGVRTNIIDNSNVNDPSQGDSLPKESIYAPAREAVNKSMSQEGFKGKGVPAEQWAREVAGVLAGGKAPPAAIWKGESAGMARMATTAPWEGLFEGMIKRMTGLDVVEGVIREERKGKK